MTEKATSYVIFQIASDDKSTIDAILNIINGEAPAKPAAKKAPAKKAPAKKAAPVEEEEEELEEEDATLTLTDLKNSAKAAKKVHGEQFMKDILVNDYELEEAPLLRMLSAVLEENYEEIIAAFDAGPEEEELEEEEAEEFEVDIKAVKAAIRAYSKENGMAAAKKVMKAHGAAALANVDDLDEEALAALFAEVQ